MAERIFGIETEYAFAALGRRETRIGQRQTVSEFLELAKAKLPHLPDMHSGMFLQNGARFYIDSGAHPELCTPEILNPWDACRYLLAGDRILTELASELAERSRTIHEVLLTRCNVCYGQGTTWGRHECYGHRADPARLRDELIPHLVSRLIYTGSGGFDNRSGGLIFMISPRVAHLTRVSSNESTHSRGIFHQKDETLSCNGYHRLHVLCGESVSSQTSLWLTIGVTSLVVAMIEADLQPCQGIQLRDPLDAMRQFAHDVTMTAQASSVDGRRWTAIEIQRQILKKIEDHIDHPIMPPWASQVCQRLRNILDRLEEGPGSVAGTLDWAIKLSLYQEYARREGVDWESLKNWNQHLGEQDLALWETESLFVEHLRPSVAARARSFLERNGLDSDGRVLTLHQKLCEMDSRFTQLGERGIFATLDRTGVLDHAVPGVDNIEHAMVTPPSSGRAMVRGRCVRQLHSKGEQYHCDWMGVWDRHNRRYVDLSDPFTTKQQWKDTRPAGSIRKTRLGRVSRDMLQEVHRLYDRGRYEDALESLDTLRPVSETLDSNSFVDIQRMRSWVQSRRGFLDSVAILDSLAGDHGHPFWLITDYVSAYRFAGLVPASQISEWIDKGLELMTQHPNDVPERIATFQEHHGYFLMSEGRLEEARDILEEARETLECAGEYLRIWCRATVTLAEVYRRLGEQTRAMQLAATAETAQVEHDFEGDRVDFSRLCLAKIQDGPARARSILQEALAVQTGSNNRMGETRTLLLLARFPDDNADLPAVKRRILKLKRDLPGLAQCKLLAKILRRWKTWTKGELLSDESGDLFWGV